MAKGLRTVSKNAGGGSQGRWDDSFKEELFKYSGKATQIRLFELFDQIPHHWVEFESKKEGKGLVGFFTLCINHNYDTGEAADYGCPYCKLGLSVTNYVYGYVIHRPTQKKQGTTIQPIRLTPRATHDILALTESAYPDENWPEGWTPEYEGHGPDATDPRFGFDFTIKKETTNNKVTYPVSLVDGGKIPLKKSEFTAFKQKAAQTNYAQLAKAHVEKVSQAEQNLIRLGLMDGPSNTTRGKSKDYTKYDEPPEGDEDSLGEEEGEELGAATTSQKSASKKPQKTTAKVKPKAEQKESLFDEDDDDERELPFLEEGEDDEDESMTYASDDEDDAPDFDED